MKKDWRPRFWKYVTYEPNTGCWPWLGANTGGYGTLGVGSKMKRATHLSFEIHNGRKPNGIVLHSCDTPACVNPGHLSEGSHKDNVKDMISKGRHGNLAMSMISKTATKS